MVNTQLCCYIDFQDFYYKNVKDIVDSKIKELCLAAQDMTVPLYLFDDAHISIEILSNEEVLNERELIKLKKENKINLPKSFFNKGLLKIHTNYVIPDYSPLEFEKLIKEIDPTYFEGITIEENNKILINIAFQKTIFDLILATNLSNLGSLPVLNGIIIQDGDGYPTKLRDIFTGHFTSAKKYIEEWKYPKLNNLEFKQTWNWLKERKDYLIGFSENKTGRALGNYSYLMSRGLDNILFRAVMGIEALFAKGTGNLQDQVRSKSQIILGEQESFKKVYNNMYNFRSRYIHGDLDFPTKLSLDMTEKTVKYNQEIQDATYFAIGLLHASLQELVLRNWSGYEFDYSVKDIKKSH